jgi:hypothetical protein
MELSEYSAGTDGVLEAITVHCRRLQIITVQTTSISNVNRIVMMFEKVNQGRDSS